MAQPLGPLDPDASASPGPARGPQTQPKKKGCKKGKCSHWKGGKCRCGRD